MKQGLHFLAASVLLAGTACAACAQQPPATPCAPATRQLPHAVLAHLDAAGSALPYGYYHATAQHLREAAVGIGQLLAALPAGRHGALENDVLALQSAAIDADTAKLRRGLELERVLLAPRAHLAAVELHACSRGDPSMG
jgi:hypothetical protein